MEIEHEKQFTKEFYIKVKNLKYKDRIIDLIRHTDWVYAYSMPDQHNLLHWQVYEYVNNEVKRWEEIDAEIDSWNKH